MKANEVAAEIWRQWFAHMDRPRRVSEPMLSAADQMAFYEIATPLIANAEAEPTVTAGEVDVEELRIIASEIESGEGIAHCEGALMRAAADEIESLRAELAEAKADARQRFRFMEDAKAEAARMRQKRDALRAERDGLREALDEYGTHDGGCVAGQWTSGTPTDDGGYQMRYGHGKDEVVCERGEKPPCSCGLRAALAPTEGEE